MNLDAWVKRAPARAALLAVAIWLAAFSIQFALIFAGETHRTWTIAAILWLLLMLYLTAVIRQTAIAGMVHLVLRGWDWVSRRTKR